MLKGSRTSLNEAEPTDRPRKKLSFREPEVMGAADRRRELEKRDWRSEEGAIGGQDDRRTEEWSQEEKKDGRKTNMGLKEEWKSTEILEDRRDGRKTNTGKEEWKSGQRQEEKKEERRNVGKGTDRQEDRNQDARRKISVVDRGEWKEDGEGVKKKVSGEEGVRRSDKVDSERRRLERSLTAESYVSWLHRRISEEDEDELESQAMKIVRTVGQAFEVCHKLSTSTPSPLDDEPDPLRDLEASSEKDSDAFSEPRKGDGMCDVPRDSDLNLDLDSPPVARSRHLHLDMIPPPPATLKPSSAPAGLGETITSPLLEPLKDTSDVPSAGSALSAHHEIQLLREQLEQQIQQTQAAVAQAHLLRDQLTAETTARIEAQARTHQLLVHNKELLDHITALVSHLQDTERSKHDANVTVMPQVYEQPTYPDMSDGDLYLGVDNRQSGAYVTAPSSPKSRHTAFFPQPQPLHTTPSMYTLFPTPEQHFQAQLLQRLQGLSGYPPLLSPPVYTPYNWPQYSTPYMSKRMDDGRVNEVKLDPPPARRKDREVRMVEDARGRDFRTDEGNRGREAQGDKSRDTRMDSRSYSKDKGDGSRERGDASWDRRDGSRDRRERPESRGVRDDRWERQESKDRRDEIREQSERRDIRDRREGSRDRREESRDPRDRREGSRDPRDRREGSRDPRDRREGSRDPREGSRDIRDRRDDPKTPEGGRGPSPKIPPSPKPPASPLSPSAKVFRWFKLIHPQANLSRPESGFVDGEKSQKDEDSNSQGGRDEEQDSGSQSLLQSLSSRKRRKLLKLQLGRMTTF